MDNIHEGRYASRSARCMNNFDDIHACRTHPGWLVGSHLEKNEREKFLGYDDPNEKSNTYSNNY